MAADPLTLSAFARMAIRPPDSGHATGAESGNCVASGRAIPARMFDGIRTGPTDGIQPDGGWMYVDRLLQSLTAPPRPLPPPAHPSMVNGLPAPCRTGITTLPTGVIAGSP